MGELVERKKTEPCVAIMEAIQWLFNSILGKKKQRLNIL